ncbi:DinB family protein [Chitinophaga agrisoli]|uniref:DinB family protein n=1 Tax=Chitinophaga agrisoli TaxID=2607653 RepID=A0A5B2W362_9BACT|nr:DinB family protein [Chitinophaga agrisoli]KAA2244699.1 DinB family protein [Chitinophaga agrisoli]
MSAVFNSVALLEDLTHQVQRLVANVEDQLTHLPDAVLQLPPAQGKWSALQCLDHLNIYSRFYLPQLARVIAEAQASQPATAQPASAVFKSSALGHWFTKTMQPKPDGALPMRMQAPKNARPAAQLDTTQVIKEFMAGQQQLLALLQQARNVDLGKLKVPTSLASWLKLPLGDTFRFFIAHEERHVLQALRAVGSK